MLSRTDRKGGRFEASAVTSRVLSWQVFLVSPEAGSIPISTSREVRRVDAPSPKMV